MATPASASRRKPIICSSVKRFFTSNLLKVGNWTPNRHATQRWGYVGWERERRFGHAANRAAYHMRRCCCWMHSQAMISFRIW
ncbi:hypothetical protein F0H32_07730 [Xanthomonas translucens pv. undulosa]|nr:hypothetical protein F0H32_07730 [Xanthomonas translucens pv. undulosa]